MSSIVVSLQQWLLRTHHIIYHNVPRSNRLEVREVEVRSESRRQSQTSQTIHIPKLSSKEVLSPSPIVTSKAVRVDSGAGTGATAAAEVESRDFFRLRLSVFRSEPSADRFLLLPLPLALPRLSLAPSAFAYNRDGAASPAFRTRGAAYEYRTS